MIHTPIVVIENGVIVGFTEGASKNLKIMGFEFSTPPYSQKEYSAIQYKPRNKYYTPKANRRKSNSYIIRPLT